MSVYFADTSALAKRYLAETGSTWVLSWILPATSNITVVAEIVSVEMFSLLARRIRENTLSAANAALLRNNFLWHIEKEYLVIAIENLVLAQARQLVNKYPLRALDAIQLACAIQAEATLNTPIIFISADKNLLSAASAEGFSVDDPNAHP